MSGVERVVGIDWSGRVDAAGQRRHIWAGVWSRGAGGKVSVGLEAGRTRVEIAEWLVELARETPRMVVGFDFCFGYPAWFVREELGVSSGPAFWKRVVEEGLAERWLMRGAEDRRFWGRPHKRPAEFSGENLHRMLRATDIDCKIAALIPEAERQARVRGITPKSVFQVGGAGSVGTASLRGFAVLLRLREAGFRVWPFDRPMLVGASPRPLVVEMYTRLNTGPVRKANAEARRIYLKKKRGEDAAYAAVSRGVMQKAMAGEDAFDALVSTMVMAEERETFARLPAPRDPLCGIEGWTWSPARTARVKG
ncbi:MAG: hypothetical protein WBY53_08685 [Acidobacteriaceae bacterium]